MSDPKYHDAHVAGIYRAIALRFYSRYVGARKLAEFRGGDLLDHGPLTNQAEADKHYEAVANEALEESPDSTDAALALVEFAGVIAADRLTAGVMLEPINDERDAYHQARALAEAAGWLNRVAIDELAKKEQARLFKELLEARS